LLSFGLTLVASLLAFAQETAKGETKQDTMKTEKTSAKAVSL
jgi:hypothetical protein